MLLFILIVFLTPSGSSFLQSLAQKNNDTGSIISNNSSNKTPTKTIITTTQKFLTYENPVLGLKIQYPPDWSKKEYPFDPSQNNTIVAFYSPSSRTAALGNVSGVSGNFVPYVDIFEFYSHGESLDQIVAESMSNFANFNLIESKQVVLKDNTPGHILIYTVTIGKDETLKKQQTWVMSSGKVYVITFNAQEALYSNFIATVQRMIDSFEITGQRQEQQ
jgi:eukaryotic-like serine/threonine-protein kinase